MATRPGNLTLVYRMAFSLLVMVLLLPTEPLMPSPEQTSDGPEESPGREKDQSPVIQVRGRRPGSGIAGTYTAESLRHGAEAAAAGRVSEVVEKQTGVKINRYGPPGTFSTFMLRGANPEQTGVYINGSKLNDPLGGPVNLENLPLAMFEDAEIYRSHSPVHLSGSHIGGALNLVPVTPPRGKQYYFVSTGAHTLRGGHLGVGLARSGQTHYLVAEGSHNTYEYLDNGGTPFLNTRDDIIRERQNADYGQLGYTGLYDFNWLSSNFKIITDYIGKETGLPGVIGRPTQKVRLGTYRFLTDVFWKYLWNPRLVWRTKGSFQFSQSDLRDPELELAAGYKSQRRRQYRGDFGFQPILYFFDNRLQVYGQSMGRHTPIYLEDQALAKRSEADLGVAFDYEPWDWLGRLTLQAKGHYIRDIPEAGLHQVVSHREFNSRSDWLNTSSLRAGVYPGKIWRHLRGRRGTDPGRSKSDRKQKQSPVLEAAQKTTDSPTPISPPAGKNHRPEEMSERKMGLTWEVYAMVALAERFPSVTESFGDGGLLLPAPDLQKETGLTHTTGLRGGLAPGAWTMDVYASYFQTKMDDLILLIANSQKTMIAVNTGRARISGWEARWKADYRHFLKLDLRYTWLDAVDLGRLPHYYGKYLPYRPRHQFHGLLETGSRRYRWFGGASFTGANYRDRYNSYPYYLEARWNLMTGVIAYLDQAYHHQLVVSIKNILNQLQPDVLGYPIAGRYYEIKYTGRFE